MIFLQVAIKFRKLSKCWFRPIRKYLAEKRKFWNHFSFKNSGHDPPPPYDCIGIRETEKPLCCKTSKQIYFKSNSFFTKEHQFVALTTKKSLMITEGPEWPKFCLYLYRSQCSETCKSFLVHFIFSRPQEPIKLCFNQILLRIIENYTKKW